MSADDSGVFEVPPSDAPPVARVGGPPPAASPAPAIDRAAAPRAGGDVAAPRGPTMGPTPIESVPAANTVTPAVHAGDEVLNVPAAATERVGLAGIMWAPPTAGAARPADTPRASSAGASSTEVVRLDLPASDQTVAPARAGRRITVSARKLEFPSACACCLSPAATERFDAVLRRKRGPNHEQRVWTVPYCTNCLAHVRRARRADGASIALGIVAGIAFATVWIALGAPLVGLLVGIAVGVGSWGLCRRTLRKAVWTGMPGACASAGAAVTYEYFKGTTHRLRFENGGYADEFTRLNAKKIV